MLDKKIDVRPFLAAVELAATGVHLFIVVDANVRIQKRRREECK